MANACTATLVALLLTAPRAGAVKESASVESLARKLVVAGSPGAPGEGVALRNGYARPIAAYAYRRPGRPRAIVDFALDADRWIAPDALLRIARGGPRGEDDRRRPEPPGLVLEAVVFDDATYDGDFLAINAIMGRRAGVAAGLRRAAPMLRETLALPDPQLTAGFDALVAAVAALPETPTGSARETAAFDARDVAVGLRRTRGELLRELSRLRGPIAADPAAAAGRLRQGLETRLARCEDVLRRVRIVTGAE